MSPSGSIHDINPLAQRIGIILLALFLVLASVPTMVSADLSYEERDLELLTAGEREYVNATLDAYSRVHGAIEGMRAYLAKPTHVTLDQWQAMGDITTEAASRLTIVSPPSSLAGMTLYHREITAAAIAVRDAAAGFEETLKSTGPAQVITGAGEEELGFLAMAVQLTEVSKAVDALEESLHTAEAAFAEKVGERILQEEEKVSSFMEDYFGISYCFIATAAYGTPAADEIDVLREFRDEVLLHCGPGQVFVDFYYKYSPPAADFIAERKWLRTLVRDGFVDPIVWLVDETRGHWEPIEAH